MNINLQAVFWVLVTSFCFLSYYYILRAFDDGRSRIRTKYHLYRLKKQGLLLFNKLNNPKYDALFRKVGLSKHITSERFNLVRLVLFIFFSTRIILKVFFDVGNTGLVTLFLFLTIPVLLEPRKPFPLYYILIKMRDSYIIKVNHEVYQLYNEICAEFITKGDRIGNMYHFMMQLRPYYRRLKPIINRMLPLLRENLHHKAWDIFEKEIETEEARSLAIVMKEVENTSIEETVATLENKRAQFANALYNRYKDYLMKRKSTFFAIVAVGAIAMVGNPVVAFFLWYSEVMSTVNNM